jgi:hypothetical protein
VEARMVQIPKLILPPVRATSSCAAESAGLIEVLHLSCATWRAPGLASRLGEASSELGYCGGGP